MLVERVLRIVFLLAAAARKQTWLDLVFVQLALVYTDTNQRCKTMTAELTHVWLQRQRKR